MGAKFLGLDSSTQSLSASIIEVEKDSSSRLVYESSLNFDAHFPNYGIRNGVIPNLGGVAHTPPQVWVEALDALLQQMRTEGIDLHEIAAVAVSGQQHGSVYLNESAPRVLAALRSTESLASQIKSIYSRNSSPIWMDSSASEECREISDSLGGPAQVCELTGSEAFERFTGPQIRKFYKVDPQAYQKTAFICLVSSFIPSLLIGKIAAIDPGDGSGMNLMDIRRKNWSHKALDATAPGLALKLLPITPSDQLIGLISPYFVQRYGFNPACAIAPGTGDNPSSLVGLGLVSPGSIGISLGTSDTVFAYMSQPSFDPSGQSHVFGSPTGDYMSLSCYKNGSLARDSVRNQFGLSWSDFDSILQKVKAGNDGKIMLPYFDTEIIPRLNYAEVQRYGFDANDKEANVKGVVEAQMMSMCTHSEWMPDKPERIYVTGGASANNAILQCMADVFAVPVFRQNTTNAAGLGAALRAFHAYLNSNGRRASWEELSSPYINQDLNSALIPEPEAEKVYGRLKKEYSKQEKAYLAKRKS